jgi:hypothetical protein
MKLTLDHNCIIDLAKRTTTGALVRKAVENSAHQCFVVNIGASEMRERGIEAGRYNKFEELLAEARIEHLPRLDPMGMWDVTFWDRCVLADDNMSNLSDEIETILFGSKLSGMPPEGLDSPIGKKWLNRICDARSLWCHIHYKNDTFLTSDGNFMKETKLPRLLALGAGRICSPVNL